MLDPMHARDERKSAEKSVVRHIQKERKKFRVCIHQQWRKGLSHLHSTQNSAKRSDDFLAGLRVSRLMELDASFAKESVTKPRYCALSSEEASSLRGTHATKADQALHAQKRQFRKHRTDLLR